MFRGTRRLLAELCANKAGNTMVLAAVAILVLLAAVGGGVDMSRAYMTRTNLQSACDAGVLAGRKALAKTGVYETVEQERADKMFTFNMKAEATNSTDVEFDSQANDDGSVSGTASAKMPTVIMKMFNVDDFDLSVECSAELQMASADIIFVLDTTLSMNCPSSDNDCTAGTTEHENDDGEKDSRLQALRDAVGDFHLTVAKSVTTPEETSIRYAFVPYSSSVNIKQLLASAAPADGQFKSSWLATTVPYATTVAAFDTAATWEVTSDVTTPSTETYSSNISSSNCNKYAANNYPSNGSNPVTSGTAPSNVTTTTYSLNKWTEKAGSNPKVGSCVRNKSVNVKKFNSSKVASYKFTRWKNITKNIDVADLISNKAMSIYTGTGTIGDSVTVATRVELDRRQLVTTAFKTGSLAGTSTPWNGCIEERATVHDLTMNPVPDGAWDLNINDEPDGTAPTLWKPYWQNIVFGTGSSAKADQCPPTPMRGFEKVDIETYKDSVPDWLDTYLTGMEAEGYTYHDIGMIWAARLGSTRGMFKENAVPKDIPSVSRHVIFMTDGIMNPDLSVYSAYGAEQSDRRVAPAGTNKSTLITYHNNRFLAACAAAEQEGYTVWVIAFGKDITVEMKNCSTADRWYHATDTTQLSNAFKFIAGQVADLRINK